VLVEPLEPVEPVEPVELVTFDVEPGVVVERLPEPPDPPLEPQAARSKARLETAVFWKSVLTDSP